MLGEIGLLGGLGVDDVVNVLAAVLLVLPLIDWTAVLVIGRVRRLYPSIRALRERHWIARAIALLTTTFALLGLSRLGHVELPDGLAAILIVLAACSLSAINAAFLWQYRHALFGRVQDVPVDRLHREEDEHHDVPTD